MNFADYRTENLERISLDPRYAKYHEQIVAILRNRERHLSVKLGISILTEVARTGNTTNYRIFFESCVGGEVKWNHTKMGQTARFLGRLQRFCAQQGLPVLTALVVNKETGECGAGFFKDLVALGHASSFDDPNEAVKKERDRCWTWAAGR